MSYETEEFKRRLNERIRREMERRAEEERAREIERNREIAERLRNYGG